MNKPLVRKIGNSHVIWFKESNSWVQLEEPAWFVFRKFSSGNSAGEIAKILCKRYSLPVEEGKIFAGDIITQVKRLRSESFHPEDRLSHGKHKSPAKYYSCHQYNFNRERYQIFYGSRRLEYIMHPSFSHLEIRTDKKPHHSLEVFSVGSKHILKTRDREWSHNDPVYLKRKLFIELTNILYRKSEQDWISYIHGSAVSNGTESIILSTGTGSGKSTLAALLCEHGLKFVSDDYVAIDSRFCKAYPFPAALSVKDGAFPLLSQKFESLKSAEIFYFKGTDKTVRYLPFPADPNFYKPVPVKSIVFLKYEPSRLFTFRKVPPLEAIRRYNDEAWVSPLPKNARKFITWFPGLECYELIYSDNQLAISKIMSLFNADQGAGIADKK